MQCRDHWHYLSKDNFWCPLCQKGLDKRLKGLWSGQRTNDPLKRFPCYLKAFMNKWLFTYFCLSESLVRDEDRSLPFLFCTIPLLSKPIDDKSGSPSWFTLVLSAGEESETCVPLVQFYCKINFVFLSNVFQDNNHIEGNIYPTVHLCFFFFFDHQSSFLFTAIGWISMQWYLDEM